MLKKIFAVTLLLVAMLTVGCGGEKKSPPKPEKVTVGVITHLNASEEEYNALMLKLEKSYRPSKANISMNFKYFNNINEMQMALESGQIDMISVYQCVADYMINRNPQLQILKSERVLSDSFCFAVREGDSILRNDLNKAISSMMSDGTLAKLSKQYIIDLKGTEEPPAVEIEQIPDADTVKVAVTGDLPPFDLVLSDGKPAGFSTAVLAEISKRIGKNIELVNIDSDARASALTSKIADVVFWVSVPKDSTLVPANIDTPAGIAISEPYYSDSIVHVEKK